MGIWAHPDDDTYSMGGIMAAAIKNGQKVVIVTATRGEAGVQDESRWPAERLGDIRSQEMAKALSLLGVNDHHWLDYPDGGCLQQDIESATDRIAELISHYRPDSIMTFGPEGMTGHDDHKTASKWAGLAVKKAGAKSKIYHATQTQDQYDAMLEADKQFNIFFNIDRPPLCSPAECAIHFELDNELYNLKLAALKVMESQTEGMFKVFGDTLKISLGTEAFIQAK